MIPVPFPCNPGDKLRITKDRPYGTRLVTGDLVTVQGTGVRVEQGRPLPVVSVSTAHGPQILGLDAVEPYTPPTYTPAEANDVVDAFLRAMAAADPELGTWATDADTALGAADSEVSEQLTGAVAAPPQVADRRALGEAYTWDDADGDELTVAYYEQDCDAHGREGLFILSINDEAAVIVPADAVTGLIHYLYTRKKHSERPQD